MLSVDFRTTIFGEEIKKKKKIHRFNVVQQIIYVYGNKKERLSLYIKSGLHKKVFILIIR